MVLPDQFRNLVLTQEQKQTLEEDFELALVRFSIENSEIVPTLDDSDSDDSLDETRPKGNKRRIKSMFMRFAKNHEAMLDKLVKENEDRVLKLALERRKATVV